MIADSAIFAHAHQLPGPVIYGRTVNVKINSKESLWLNSYLEK